MEVSYHNIINIEKFDVAICIWWIWVNCSQTKTIHYSYRYKFIAYLNLGTNVKLPQAEAEGNKNDIT